VVRFAERVARAATFFVFRTAAFARFTTRRRVAGFGRTLAAAFAAAADIDPMAEPIDSPTATRTFSSFEIRSAAFIIYLLWASLVAQIAQIALDGAIRKELT
jgi:hypothetical protein